MTLKTTDGEKIQTRIDRNAPCTAIITTRRGGWSKEIRGRYPPHVAICTCDNIFYRHISRTTRTCRVASTRCVGHDGARQIFTLLYTFVYTMREKENAIDVLSNRHTRTSRAVAAREGGGAHAWIRLDNKLEFKRCILYYFISL